MKYKIIPQRIIHSQKENIYSKVDNKKRLQLLEMVKNDHKSLKEASKALDINYSTAKTILRVYRIEHRILKKSSPGNNDDKSKDNEQQEKIIRRQSTQSTSEGSSLLSPNQTKTLPLNDEYAMQVHILQSMIYEWMNELIYNEAIVTNMTEQLSQLSFLLRHNYYRMTNNPHYKP